MGLREDRRYLGPIILMLFPVMLSIALIIDAILLEFIPIKFPLEHFSPGQILLRGTSIPVIFAFFRSFKKTGGLRLIAKKHNRFIMVCFLGTVPILLTSILAWIPVTFIMGVVAGVRYIKK